MLLEWVCQSKPKIVTVVEWTKRTAVVFNWGDRKIQHVLRSLQLLTVTPNIVTWH